MLPILESDLRGFHVAGHSSSRSSKPLFHVAISPHGCCLTRPVDFGEMFRKNVATTIPGSHARARDFGFHLPSNGDISVHTTVHQVARAGCLDA